MRIRTQALVEGGAAGKVCDPGLQKGSEGDLAQCRHWF